MQVVRIFREKEYDGNTSVQEHNCSIDKLIIKGDEVRLLDEFAYGRPFLSLLAGHRAFESENWDVSAILERYDRESRQFRMRKESYELYPRSV